MTIIGGLNYAGFCLVGHNCSATVREIDHPMTFLETNDPLVEQKWSCTHQKYLPLLHSSACLCVSLLITLLHHLCQKTQSSKNAIITSVRDLLSQRLVSIYKDSWDYKELTKLETSFKMSQRLMILPIKHSSITYSISTSGYWRPVCMIRNAFS